MANLHDADGSSLDSDSPYEEEDGENEEESFDNTMAPGVARRLEKAKYRLNNDERRDLIASLEHIVTVGGFVKHTIKRCETWKKSQKDGHDILGNAIVIPERVQERLAAANVAIPEDLPSRMLHAEDVRIYGRHGRPRDPWPLRHARRLPRGDEVQWDLEHGDGIHSLAFADARLSEVSPIPPLKRQRMDGPNLSVETTTTAIDPEFIPRAMLLRCWQRAMQAASTVMHFDSPLTSDSKEIGHGPGRLSEGERKSSGPAEAERKCKNLQITLPKGLCPHCGIPCDTEAYQRRHFFGTASQRGCGWGRIRQRQRDMIDQVLQSEIRFLCDDLVELVVAAAMKREKADGLLYNWHDIVAMLESEVTLRHEFIDPSNRQDRRIETLLETMEGPSRSSIVLNAQLLESIKIRLIERYADLPR